MIIGETTKSLDIVKNATDYLANVPEIHFGGCLVAAYSFYLFLEKNNLPIEDFRLVSLNRNKKIGEYVAAHRKNQKWIENPFKGFPSASAHFGWTFDEGENIFDTDGEIYKEKYPLRICIPPDLTKAFSKIAISTETWNSKFNKEKYIPLIERDLGISLEV